MSNTFAIVLINLC